MVISLVGVAVLYILLKVLITVGIIGPYWQIILNDAMIYVIGGLGLSVIYGLPGSSRSDMPLSWASAPIPPACLPLRSATTGY
jgi:uncharacterized membrane protein